MKKAIVVIATFALMSAGCVQTASSPTATTATAAADRSLQIKSFGASLINSITEEDKKAYLNSYEYKAMMNGGGQGVDKALPAYRRASAARHEGRFADALKEYEYIGKVSPAEKYDAKLMQAWILTRMQRRQEAITLLTEIAQSSSYLASAAKVRLARLKSGKEFF
ncbi:MAG: hypothetical protein SFU56_21810 [Capsulimonadales bacterium]|nr:hypothetical protein [Capsulimonadales bacterium]